MMANLKLLLIFTLAPIITNSQVQIGNDIDGEAAGDTSGNAIDISDDGNIVAIGADHNTGNGDRAGQVRVYKYDSGSWNQVGADLDGEDEYNYFGSSVSLSEDGSILAVGATGNFNPTTFTAGNVRIFENVSGDWVQLGQSINGGTSGEHFGSSVSLSNNGEILAISASHSYNNKGHVQTYKYEAGEWIQFGNNIGGQAAGDSFGHELSLSGDGNIIAIGAPFNDNNGVDSGNVRVFQNLSGTWTLMGDEIRGEMAGDSSGFDVSISDNGMIVAMGGTRNDGNGQDSGYVRVFAFQSGNWVQIGEDIDGEAIDDRFGSAVSLSNNGNVIAIGGVRNDGNGENSGHVRIYQNQGGNWNQIGSDIDGESAYDQSGLTARISNNGRVAIGAIGNDDNGSNSGHVRVFEFSSLLGINEQIHSKITLYPNPVTDLLYIHIENGILLNNVRVYDMSGNSILETSKNNINISTLSTGIYIVKVESDLGIGIYKLIKK